MSLSKAKWIVTSSSQMSILNVSFRQLILNLGADLLLLWNLWILIDIHQISHNTTSLSWLLLLLLQFVPALLIEFFTSCHVVVEVLIYDLVFVLDLLSVIALASVIVIQTLFNHGDAASGIVRLFIELIVVSIISVAWCQELSRLLRDSCASAALGLATSNQKLALLPLASSMLIDNIYLAVIDIPAGIHHRLIHVVLFILSLLCSETLI